MQGIGVAGRQSIHGEVQSPTNAGDYLIDHGNRQTAFEWTKGPYP